MKKFSKGSIKIAYLILVMILVICLIVLFLLGLFKIKSWESILKIIPSLITSVIAVSTSFLGFNMLIVQLDKTDEEKEKRDKEKQNLEKSMLRPLWYGASSPDKLSYSITFLSHSEKDIFVRDVKIWQVKHTTKEKIDYEINKIEFNISCLEPWIEYLGTESAFHTNDLSVKEIKKIKYVFTEYIPIRMDRVKSIRNSLFLDYPDSNNICIPIKVASLGSVKEGTLLTSKDYYSNRIKDNFELIANLSEEAHSKIIVECFTDYNEHVFTYIDENDNLFFNLVDIDNNKNIFPESMHIDMDNKNRFFEAVNSVQHVSSKNIGTLNEDWNLYNTVKHLMKVMEGIERPWN